MATKEIYIEDEDGEFEFELTVKYNLEPFRPGRYYGDPGDCYPDEGGEVEIYEIKIFEFGRWYDVGQDEVEECGYDFDNFAMEVIEAAADDYEEPAW